MRRPNLEFIRCYLAGRVVAYRVKMRMEIESFADVLDMQMKNYETSCKTVV